LIQARQAFLSKFYDDCHHGAEAPCGEDGNRSSARFLSHEGYAAADPTIRGLLVAISPDDMPLGPRQTWLLIFGASWHL
jgi:hypothetical protein